MAGVIGFSRDRHFLLQFYTHDDNRVAVAFVRAENNIRVQNWEFHI
jgi:hypothetical protein